MNEATNTDHAQGTRRRQASLRVIDGEFGRTPPHSIEAEEMLLGCLLLDGTTVMAKCHALRIKPAAFYVPANRVIFEALERMYRRSDPMDLCVLAEDLKAERLLDSVGGYAYLTQISKAIPTTAQANYFLEKVRDLCALRETIGENAKMVEESFGFTGTGSDLAQRLEAHASWVSRAIDFLRAAQATMTDAATAGLERTLKTLAGKRDKSRWLTSGLVEFDARFTQFDVFNEDWFNVLGAPQSGGKSSYSRQIAMANLRKGKTVLMFLLETSLGKCQELMACSLAGINARYLDQLPRDKQAEYEQALREVNGWIGKTLWICDEVVPVETLVARIEDHARRWGVPDMVVVDHMHLLNSRDRMQKREAEMGYIAKQLKLCFKRVNTTGIVLAQLNRSYVKDGRRPRMSDLRDSGEIEQAADRVILLFTPDQDPRGIAQDANQDQVYVEMIQDKNRNGPTGHRGFWFRKSVTRYFDIGDNELRSLEGKSAPQAPSPGSGGMGASKAAFLKGKQGL